MDEQFRYDVRIRDRLLKKGLLAESDVARYLDALKDVESLSEPVGLEQPGVRGSQEGA